MKRYLMIFLAVLMISTAASAQIHGYMGLFADETHASWCASGHDVPGSFSMYIFCLPRADGTFCAEFQLLMPADPTLILGAAIPQVGYSVIMGALQDGVSFCFLDCQNDWIWIYSCTMFDTAGNQNSIGIGPHPDTGAVLFNSCVPPLFDIYDAVVFNNLYVNYVDGVDPECDATATAERSWGAIKSLYAE